MYNRAITSVRTSEGIISEFPITIELHQESTLNSYPFVFAMNEITKLIQDNVPWYMLFVVTTKKGGYPSVFKSAGIAPKSAGIGSKFLSRRFFSRRFKPPGNECGYRVARPVPALFKNAGKGIHPIPALLKALV